MNAEKTTLIAHPAAAACLWVVCLCAQWCRACNDYQAVFAGMAATMGQSHPETQFVWIDVEDQADLVGDLDIDTFPTLLVGDGDGVRFLGAVTPQADVLSRLLEAMHQPDAPRGPHRPDSLRIIEQLAASPDVWVRESLAKI
jgi:thioredoxin-like negative regulator of GroEL